MRWIKAQYSDPEAVKWIQTFLRASVSGTPLSLSEVSKICHAISVHRGWWFDSKGQPVERNFGEALALVHSEVSEALEAGRKDIPSDHLPGESGVGEELADAIIRILDLGEALGLDIPRILLAKMQFNLERKDHDSQARTAEGGKQF